ncbi:MAG: DUF1330 domain-containing protein [Erythrobacter sp.]
MAFLFSAPVMSQALEETTVPANPDEDSPGYLMVTGWYKDAAVQSAYIKKIGPVIRKFGYVSGKIGVPGVNLKVIEGDWTPRGFSLLRFSSETAVKKFWYSEEYQNDVKPIREGYSALDVMKTGAAYGTKPTMDDKSALLIFFVDLKDRKRLMTQYVPYAPAIVARYGGKFLISSAQWNMELLEGEFPSQSIVIVEFPTGKALRDFWNDKEYKALSEIRKSTGKWSVVEVMPFSQRSRE